MFSSLAKVCSVLLLTIFFGCAERESIVFAKIDFTSDKLTDVVVNVSGLSVQESWGRWADADLARSVKIEFSKPLPPKFIVSIKGPTLTNDGSATLKVGSFAEKFVMPNKASEITEIFVTINEPSQVIEIVPDTPISPQQLGINNDPRKLSIGFSEILITE